MIVHIVKNSTEVSRLGEFIYTNSFFKVSIYLNYSLQRQVILEMNKSGTRPVGGNP